jgi:hypothetical protein
MDYAWTPLGGMVHVRAVDRAGNLSAVSSAEVGFSVYLPLLVK